MKNKYNSLSVAHLNMRTVSSLESFHSAVNRTVPKKSHFFKFTMGLKYHECRKADKMLNLVRDLIPKNQLQKKHLRDQVRENKINHFTKLLCSEDISVREFLLAMAKDENCKSYFQCC